MTDDVGVITGDLTVRTVRRTDGLVAVTVQYAGADEWYTLTGSPAPALRLGSGVVPRSRPRRGRARRRSRHTARRSHVIIMAGWPDEWPRHADIHIVRRAHCTTDRASPPSRRWGHGLPRYWIRDRTTQADDPAGDTGPHRRRARRSAVDLAIPLMMSPVFREGLRAQFSPRCPVRTTIRPSAKRRGA
ncbi:hypothetical protein ACRAWF_09620 [Streptomyces sp. L7]